MTTNNNNSNNDDFENHNLEQDKTEVFDEIDMASHLAMGYAEQALKNHREKINAKKVHHPDFDGVHCCDCGDPMHPVRLAMDCDRCTECQEIEDKYQNSLKRR